MSGEGIYAKVAAAFRNMTDRPHLGEALGGPLPPEPALPGESTSAALRRVEQERDELAARLELAEQAVQQGLRRAAELHESRREAADLREARDVARASLRVVTEQRDEAIEDRNEIVRSKARMQRDLDSELAEAREQLAVATIAARKVTVTQKECEDLRDDYNAALAELASVRRELEWLRANKTT